MVPCQKKLPSRPIGVPEKMTMRLAKRLKLDPAQARAAIEAVLEDIRANPGKIRGFGTFYVAERAAYKLTSMSDPDVKVAVPRRKRLAFRSQSYPVKNGA